MENENEKVIKDLNERVDELKRWNRWFFSRVKYLRECQKEYFRLRTSDALKKSKELEKEVDEEIKRVDGVMLKREQDKQLKFDL